MASDKVKEALDNLRQAMIDDGMDPATVDARLFAAQPTSDSIVGNFADLQRLGAMLVGDDGDNVGTEVADAFVVPPDVDADRKEKDDKGDVVTAGTAAPLAGSPDFGAMTKSELIDEARAQGLSVTTSMTKDELIDALEGG